MRHDREYLHDILEYARRAIEYTAAISDEDFADDTLIRDATAHAISLIGEAARHLSDDFRQSHADIPWPRIISMRNRLIHAYGDVDVDIVWDTVQRDLPMLIARITPLVSADE
ncbi:MAG TPA: DUF86 domain-containing protein [Armatimonadota bacterium]|nr:DUF86 domain-containing protein [Armatimonadota bacterium]